MEKWNPENFDKVLEYKGYMIGVVAGTPATKPFENGIPKRVWLYDANGDHVMFGCNRSVKTLKSAKNRVDCILKGW